MKTLKFLCTFIFCTCFVKPAMGDMTVAGYAEGKTFHFEFRPKGPEWKANEEHPRLSPRKAEKLARTKLDALLKEP